MPVIDLKNCIKCLKCVNDCPSGAIDIESGVIDETCIHCGHCVAICPESTIFPDAGDVKKLETVNIAPDEFINLSTAIRTCRNYLDKEVDNTTMDKLIENMKHYPSASNSRPLEITVIKSNDIIKQLDKQTANGLIKTMSFITLPFIKQIIKVVAPKIDVDKLSRYKDKFVANQKPDSSQICHHAPMVMLFHAPEAKFSMANADANIWATYTTLFAQTLGLASCFNGFICMAMKRSKTMKKEFNIPANHIVHTALLIGYPKVKYLNEVGREAPKSNVLD